MSQPPLERPPDRAASRRFWTAFAVVWLLTLAYVAWHIDRDWVPHDSGMLGQSAERVLRGQLPHRDFIEVYTGGLTFLNAFAFSLFGVRLIVLRWVLFGFVALWIPALFYVASRFARPLAAGAIVLLAVVWSVPNYPAPLPSWYNLFFATFGVAALLRYLEKERAAWLVGAGVAAGLSVLVKITGLYLVAGALLFLAYHEQARAPQRAEPGGHVGPYQLVLAAGIALFIALLIRTVGSVARVADVVDFTVPPTLVALLVLWHEREVGEAPSGRRLGALVGSVIPLLLGLALAWVPMILVYGHGRALGDLLKGLFVRPLARFSYATMLPAPVLPCLFAMLPLVLLLVRGCRRQPWSWFDRLAIGVTMVSGLIAAGQNVSVYRIVWYSVRALVPAATIAGVAILASPRWARALAPRRREQLVLLLAVTAMVALVQFPFSAPIYFCYVAPLLVVTIAAILASAGGLRSFAAVSTWGFYLLFAGLFLNRTTVFSQGQAYEPDHVARLELPRAGIRVPIIQGQIYMRLVAAIKRHGAGDAYIYATPDLPEVYFLSGKQNPTRNLFEFLNPQRRNPQDVLALLDQRRVRVVVLSHLPSFSGLDAAEGRALAAAFPDSVVILPFVVRWRAAPP